MELYAPENLPGQQEGIGKGARPLAPEIPSGAKSLIAGTGGTDHETMFVQSAAHGSNAAFRVPARVGGGGRGISVLRRQRPELADWHKDQR